MYFLLLPRQDKRGVTDMKENKKSGKPQKDGGKISTVITAPDDRYSSTGVAKPDDSHVREARRWSEEHQQ